MIKGLAALAISAKYPGAAKGFLRYQERIDKRKEKLQEKLEARMLAIQKLMISRGVSNSKVKTYSTDVANVVNRLRIKQGDDIGKLVEGSEIIIKALRNDPSSAKVLKSMIEKGDKSVNYPLSPSQIVEFFPLLEMTRGGTPSGYMSNEAIEKVINSGELEDFDTFLKVLKGAATPASTSGTSVFASPFFPETKTEKINLQTKEFDSVVKKIATQQLQMLDVGSAEHDAINLAINESNQGNPSNLRNMFGIDGIIDLQENYANLPAFSDAFQNNPIIQRYNNTRLKILEEKKKRPNFLNQITTVLKPVEIDRAYGDGASNYIMRMSR